MNRWARGGTVPHRWWARPPGPSRAALPLLGALLGGGIADLAAQGSASNPDRLRPVLGAHRFVPNEITRDPFSRTYVRNALGVGRALDIEFLPSLEIEGGDTIPGLSGDLLLALLDFEYQHGVKDWMAVWGRVNLVGRLGADVGALLSEGATIMSGFELGWLLRLLETDHVALSGTLNVWKNSFTGVNVADWVAGIINAEPVPLARNVPSLQAGGGLRFAWAVSRLLGITAGSDLGFGEHVTTRKSNEVVFRIAGAVDLDLRSRTSVPLGFVLGLEGNNSPHEGNDVTDRVGRGFVRVAYTGREDFVIAVTYHLSQLHYAANRTTGLVHVGSILLNMRYYF